MYKYIFATLLLLLSGCSDTKTASHLDGKKLLGQKCTSCHNIDLPPKTYEDEKAPPMMAVAFHVTNFIQTNDESLRIPKAIEFVKDYVIHPSKEKSFCDKESLKSYGVMPSQKGKVTQEELDAIAHYMFEHFTQKNLTEAQAALNRLSAMPKGKRVALKNNCLGCHRVDKDLVGPSFLHIKERYIHSKDVLKNSILHGSANKWKSSKGAHMPSFSNLNTQELELVTTWILNIKTK